MGANRALRNLYELKVQDEGARKSIDLEFGQYLLRPTTEDDTHPSPVDRFRLVRGLRSKEAPPLEGEVWDLFRDREAVQREMNALLESRMKALM
jgi:hypothetical protein